MTSVQPEGVSAITKETQMSTNRSADTIVTTVAKCPPTSQYPVPKNLDAVIPNPGVPRADIAPSAEFPQGSPDGKRDLTVMEQHIEFFDRNKDGIIWPYETYLGFYAIGFNFLFCIMAVFVIHGGFSYPSLDSYIPHPGFPIYIKNIHRCKHGSDTGTYDTEGRYIPQRFEEIFSKFDRGKKGGLTLGDIFYMTNEIRNVMDFFGMFANKFEWVTLWLLCKNQDGLVTKDEIRRCYDGTLFYHIERTLNQKKAEKKQARLEMKNAAIEQAKTKTKAVINKVKAT
ncbi:plant seed peroxygenase [Powellomyces hirtus]|uniref:Plant seed peroxygenase n=1 Tax=Powellomyces hirtus TaxID=109895 RepID=A0A507EA50_9FUNG|nr:plant seed peroxygenase [Powellomyces hirtus]